MGHSDLYSIFVMGTCEFTERGIPIGVRVFLEWSLLVHMDATSSPIEQKMHRYWA